LKIPLPERANALKTRIWTKEFNLEYGIIGLLILALDIWALINVWGSGSSLASKLIWSLLSLILPVIGLILWFFLGPKGSAQAI